MPSAAAAADVPLPEGLARAASRALWLRVVAAHPDAGVRRGDWRRGLDAVVWQLATRTTRTMLTVPAKGATWAIMAADGCVSRAVLADRISWLIARGLLVRAVAGSTPRYRRGTRQGLDDDGLGNLAAQYILTVPEDLLQEMADDLDHSPALVPADADDIDAEVPWPVEVLPVDQTWTPSPTPADVGDETPRSAGARERPVAASPVSAWPAVVTPHTKADMLAACERLRADDPLLAQLTARHLRSLLRAAFISGATVSDVRYAINHRVDGTQHPYTDRPRWLPAWLRSRLAHWVNADGEPVAPWPSQARAQAVARDRAEQQRRRADRAHAVAACGDPVRGAARARQLLAEATGRTGPQPGVIKPVEEVAGRRRRVTPWRGGPASRLADSEPSPATAICRG
ncbi:hypothetical protein ETD86_11480 [Nonomuraea turkmeniaca]|uniref:Uncharacterized protein n=1 Tax=Nonomuraea turkmeniaca TaxID=103838 RepID=A0A5S4FP44_9ACTN|nr:hypothetical protein [Nonomuraea turkmeniaca]TMR22462.1 hypothetical protein ETD86_11480 [Nonomuraea turkmeniaca]